MRAEIAAPILFAVQCVVELGRLEVAEGSSVDLAAAVGLDDAGLVALAPWHPRWSGEILIGRRFVPCDDEVAFERCWNRRLRAPPPFKYPAGDRRAPLHARGSPLAGSRTAAPCRAVATDGGRISEALCRQRPRHEMEAVLLSGLVRSGGLLALRGSPLSRLHGFPTVPRRGRRPVRVRVALASRLTPAPSRFRDKNSGDASGGHCRFANTDNVANATSRQLK